MTKKQKVFVEEYLIDLNATQAAIRAGYSAKTANEQASRLLANVNIQQAVGKAMAERSKRTGVSQDRIIEELAKVAFINAADVIDFESATVRPEASREDKASIASIKIKESSSDKGDSTEREIRLYDKLKALEMLGKHIGMFKEKVDVQVSVPVVISGEDELED